MSKTNKSCPSSFSAGRIKPARAGSAKCNNTSCEATFDKISIKNGALKPIAIGMPE